MKSFLRAVPLLFVVTLFPPSADAQLQPRPAPTSDTANRRLVLDVVVTDHSGKAAAGLQQKDFAVFDSGHEANIVSFHAVGTGVADGDGQAVEPPVKIILLVDEVNTNFTRVSYERDQIKRFLQQNGGVLAHPISLAFFSDTGTDIQNTSSRDGNALLAAFDQHETALRTVRRSTGVYGAIERLQLSLKTLQSLAAKETEEPGRKIVVWISPGWPLLSGPGIELTAKDEASIFSSVVGISTALLQARITLSSVDPLGADAAAGSQDFYYQNFLKPVVSARRAQFGNLGLQVIAQQSGGLVLPASNDISALISRCTTDADTYYTLVVDEAPADQPNEYHALTVKVATPGLTARTRSGYYAQP